MTGIDLATRGQRPPGITGAGSARRLVALVRAGRPRQWVKNVLVAGAPLASGRWTGGGVAARTAGAFIAFCLVAWAVYLVNDVVDAEEDRRHPRKRLRPVASGELAAGTAVVAAVVLAAAGIALAWRIRPEFGLLTLTYLLVSLAYSLRLRREPVIELALVALGFLFRCAGGGLATGIPLSAWFLLVTGFGSLFLVAGKRYCELIAVDREGRRRASLAEYSPAYLRFVWGAAATVTVASYALWGDEVYRVRAHGAWALLSLFPFALAVLSYARQIDSGRAEAPEDVVLSDRAIQLIGLVWLVMVVVGASGVGA